MKSNGYPQMAQMDADRDAVVFICGRERATAIRRWRRWTQIGMLLFSSVEEKGQRLSADGADGRR
jgi:hypothetical protein